MLCSFDGLEGSRKPVKSRGHDMPTPFKALEETRTWENSGEVPLPRRDGWPLFVTHGRKAPEGALTATGNSGALNQDPSFSPSERV
jgi:hypothetical protein